MKRALVLGLTMLSMTALEAGTINFTFSVNGATTLTLTGPPSTTTPVSGVFEGSGTSTPFGAFTDSEHNQVVFINYPNRVAPGSESGTFAFSFNGGADTLTGTLNVVYADNPIAGGPAVIDTQTRTILGGTGIFAGATGTITATGNDVPNSGTPPPTAFNTFAGTGLVTAPNLTAVPEVATMPLVCAGFVALVLWKRFALRGCLTGSCRQSS